MSISRRRFLGVLSASSLAGVGRSFAWEGTSQTPTPGAHFTYVASDAPGHHGLHVYQVRGQSWRRSQIVPSPSPAALALSPDRQTLFVANRVRTCAGLPTGSVESYRIDPSSGDLFLLSRRALSLSAIEPEHLAVSPDGTRLAVACTGGGSFNLVPIGSDGTLAPVRVLRKELGFGLHPVRQSQAHPRHVLFDSAGHLLGLDYGADRVTLFGLADDHLAVHDRRALAPGNGPTTMVFHRGASRLLVASESHPGLTSFQYTDGQKHLAPEVTRVRPSSPEALCTALFAPEHSDLLLAAWNGADGPFLTSWVWDNSSLEWVERAKQILPAPVHQIASMQAGTHAFLALSAEAEHVVHFTCDPIEGSVSRPEPVAALPSPRAIVARAKDLA